MPDNAGESINGGSIPSSSESKFGTFLTRSIQDTTSQIAIDCKRAGINVIHSFKDGRGAIHITNATEKALEKVTLPAKTLDSGVRTAFVTLGGVKVDFIASDDGTPISITGGTALLNSTWDQVTTAGNEMILTTTMNIASQERRRVAYPSNSDYQVILGSDVDSATRSLAELYDNPSMDSTGISKTFSVMIWVYV